MGDTNVYTNAQSLNFRAELKTAVEENVGKDGLDVELLEESCKIQQGRAIFKIATTLTKLWRRYLMKKEIARSEQLHTNLTDDNFGQQFTKLKDMNTLHKMYRGGDTTQSKMISKVTSGNDNLVMGIPKLSSVVFEDHQAPLAIQVQEQEGKTVKQGANFVDERKARSAKQSF